MKPKSIWVILGQVLALQWCFSMKNALGLLSVCCLFTSLGGCKSSVPGDPDAGPDPDPDPDAATADGEFEVNRKLDILFRRRQLGLDD